jgi:glycosyltransferase involved in cell wall biosynthesis
MLVQVVIPAYNAERFLGDCLRSVLSQSPARVLVLDNGSQDGTRAVAESFGVDVCSQPEPGLARTLNLGYQMAEAEWIASCDADDLWLAGKLRWQLEMIQENPELDMVFGGIEQFGASTSVPISFAAHRGTMLLRRAAFEKVGSFDTGLRVGEFLDWYSRAQAAGLREACVPQVIYRRRIHDDNMGLREKNTPQEYLRMLKAHLDRKRARSEI